MGKTIDKEKIMKNFIEKLEKLDNAELSRLRRASSDIESDTRIFDILAKISSNVPKYLREKFYVISILYAMTPNSPKSDDKYYNMGKILKQSDFTEIRFKSLLNTDIIKNSFKLRQAFKYIVDNKQPVNWEVLTNDILNWGNDFNKKTQLKWAEGYYG